jgi:hypothetical protein
MFSSYFTAPNIFSAMNIKNRGDKIARIFVNLLLCTKLNIMDNNNGVNIKTYGKDRAILFIIFVRYNVVNDKNTAEHIQNEAENAHGYELKNYPFFFK